MERRNKNNLDDKGRLKWYYFNLRHPKIVPFQGRARELQLEGNSWEKTFRASDTLFSCANPTKAKFFPLIILTLTISPENEICRKQWPLPQGRK
jgi:hypothetical protein